MHGAIDGIEGFRAIVLGLGIDISVLRTGKTGYYALDNETGALDEA